MRSVRRVLPLCLLPLVTLAACGDESTILSVATPPRIEEPGPIAPTLNPFSMAVEGYPTPGELRTGFIYDQVGQPVEITYEIHDGLAIWQGDIILGEAHEIATSPAELATSAPGPLRGVVIDADGGNNRWPGGVVPYTINGSNPPTQSVVDGAIDRIEDQTPGVTLVPRNGESDYVTFQNSTGCSSEIGRIGGQQFINLKVDDGVSFCSTGNATHEILHALGMYHEQTRCDRDAFVMIDYAEVESGKEGNFYKAGSGSEGGACSGAFDIGTYDFGSIMHYAVDAFAIGSNPTIIPIVAVPAGITIGQRSALSTTDQQTIDQLYGTNNASPSAVISSLAASYPEGTSVPFDASGSFDADDDDDLLTFSWIFGDGTCPGPAACSDDNPGHTYADNGNYGYSVTVSDGFDAGAAGASIDITNVAPSVSVGGEATIDEGDTFTRSGSFTDPGADTWTATVDYGDGGGAGALALAGKNFNLSHTYVDNGLNTVTVTVTDDDAGVGSDDADVTVNNVAPTVDAGPDATVDSGEIYDFSGSFSDPGIADNPWGWVIEWGFGPNTTGSTDDQSAAITASRQVCVAGDYTVRLTVTDKDDGSGSDELTLTVPYIGVDIDIMPGTDLNPVNLKKRGNLPVAILGSADLDVADIDASTLTLGDETDPDTPIGQKNNGSYEAYLEDVNEDGFMDLVTMFHVEAMMDDGDLTALSGQLVLRGFLTDGCTNIRGVDVVLPKGT
jgi:PKD repeat protein